MFGIKALKLKEITATAAKLALLGGSIATMGGTRTLKLNTEIKQHTLIVRIEGEVDLHVADLFRERVDAALEQAGVHNLLLNLARVSFIDSSGLGVILGRYKRVSQLGGKMFAVELQPQVEKIFEISGLLRIIKLYSTEKQALQSA